MAANTNDTLPARVWLAHRGVNRTGDTLADAEFKKVLTETFIPVTVQWMHLFGLSTYIPTLWPLPSATAPQNWPEETALVIYKSVADYAQAKSTPSGRLYSLAHRLAFASGINKSDFPVRYDAQVGSTLGTSYFGGTGELDDWNSSPVHVIAIHHTSQIDAVAKPDWVQTFVQPRLKNINDLKQWVAWSNEEWMLLWICADGALVPLSDTLLGTTHFQHLARDEVVPSNPVEPFAGVALEFGETLRIQPQKP